MRKLFVIVLSIIMAVPLYSAVKNQGEFYNLVIFVHFADEPATSIDRKVSFYNNLYNDSTSTLSNSMFNYFFEASYGKLRLKSTFIPVLTGDKVTSIQSKYKRGYLKPKSIINPDGYPDAIEMNLRESRFVKDIALQAESLLPDDYVIPSNTESAIDNISFVISGSSTSGTILWPHQSIQIINQVAIRNKNVGSYIFQFDKEINTGVICHEIMHTLGAPDLYLSDKSAPKPIGNWDLMATNTTIAQGMSAYTKYRYGNWLESPEIITSEGDYTLYPVGGENPNQVYYKVQEPGKNEYFILEYRKRDGTFESNLWSSGLLVYRINESVVGNLSGQGTTQKPYGQYLFRQNGTPTEEGNVPFAALSTETGRTRIAYDSNPYPFYTDGTFAAFEIKDIGTCGDYIQFHFKPDYYSSVTEIEASKIRYGINGGKIYVEADDYSLKNAFIANILGLTIFPAQINSSSAEFDASDLPAGVYLLNVSLENGTQKVIKIKL